MPAKQYLLTAEGLAEIEKELEELKSTKRKEITEKIKVARSFGDLSENSEYDEAKNEQAMVESRIAQLEAMLKNVKVIDSTEMNNEVVHVGSKIKVYDVDFEEEVYYHIVGSTEADPLKGYISDESPVGRTLIGHGVGDEVSVETPAGVSVYKILEIEK